MTSEQNKALVRSSYETLWNEGCIDAVGTIHSADMRFHDPAAPGIEGLAAFKQVIAMYRAAFAGLHFTLHDQLAEGDKVTTRWQATGIHSGEIMGIPPTGRQMSITGISIDRIADGKIVEAWTNWDALGMLQQLGVMPTSAPA
ncbi:MAG: ester cyclase [Caldilineaceae bacterium]